MIVQETYAYYAKLLPRIVFNEIAGYTSDLLSIGDGIVIVSTIVLIVGMPILLSIAGSMFIICLTSFLSIHSPAVRLCLLTLCSSTLHWNNNWSTGRPLLC